MAKHSDTLYAFYDLAVNPNCFDVVKFVVLADLARREAGCRDLHILFVPSEGEGFREDDQFEQANREWRFRNIMLPICSLMPSCKGVTVCASRSEAEYVETEMAEHIFPEGHSTEQPVQLFEWSEVAVASVQGKEIPSLVVGGQARAFVEDWIAARAKGRKVISITLREMGFQSERNSRLDDWLAFIRGLDQGEYMPVIIRDTDSIFVKQSAEFDGVIQFPETALNIELRAAFYEACYLNLMVSNGPIELCALNTKIRYLMFKVYPEAWAKDRTHGGLPEAAVPKDGQLPIAGPHQRFIWSDDRLDVIRSEFAAMIKFLAENEAEVEAFRARSSFPPTKMQCIDVLNLLASSNRLNGCKAILNHLDGSGNIGRIFKDVIRIYRNNVNPPQEMRDILLVLCLAFPDRMESCGKIFERITASSDPRKIAKYVLILGDAHAALGEFDASIRCYRLAFEKCGDMNVALLKLGIIYEQMEKWDEAEEVLRDAISGGLHHRDVYNKYAQILRNQGKLKEAVEVSLRAFALDSSPA